MKRCPYGCWLWAPVGEKIHRLLGSGWRSVEKPTREDHFYNWGRLKDTHVNTYAYANADRHLHTSLCCCCCCRHMLKSLQAPRTSQNMTFWISYYPPCYSQWDLHYTEEWKLGLNCFKMTTSCCFLLPYLVIHLGCAFLNSNLINTYAYHEENRWFNAEE